MKRTVLSDIDCMSGTGWQPEELKIIECPNCYEIINLLSKTIKVKCNHCGIKFKIEYGVTYLMRGIISE